MQKRERHGFDDEDDPTDLSEKRRHLLPERVARIVRKIGSEIGTELRVDVECLAAEINQHGVSYLLRRREEGDERHPSAAQIDLQRCAKWIDKVLSWAHKGARNRRTSTGQKRIANAIHTTRRLGQDPLLRVLLDPSEISAASRLLRSMQRGARICSESHPVEPLSEFGALVSAVDGHLEQSRRGKKSHRRSGARVTFLNQLADLFVKYLGLAPTFTWSNYPEEEEEEGGEKGGEAHGPFVLFVKEIFRIIEPEALHRGRQLEADIQAAVGRKKGRRYENGELVIHVYEDPRDRNR